MPITHRSIAMSTASEISTPRHRIISLIGWLALVYAAAAVGAAASGSAGTFYAELIRPGWAPPGWLFGPVWTLLYALMGISAWLVWQARGFADMRLPLLLFIAQLAANALWSWLFFAWRLGTLALAEILILWILIAATTATFWRVRRLAGALLIPYLAWAAFASALTFSFLRLNPDLLS